MPTPEEIKKLSDAYAEYMCPVGDYCGGVYDDQRNSDLPIYKDDSKSVLEWLSKDYCIVPKSELRQAQKEIQRTFADGDKISEYGWKRIFNWLFGKSLFEEEQK